MKSASEHILCDKCNKYGCLSHSVYRVYAIELFHTLSKNLFDINDLSRFVNNHNSMEGKIEYYLKTDSFSNQHPEVSTRISYRTYLDPYLTATDFYINFVSGYKLSLKNKHIINFKSMKKGSDFYDLFPVLLKCIRIMVEERDGINLHLKHLKASFNTLSMGMEAISKKIESIEITDPEPSTKITLRLATAIQNALDLLDAKDKVEVRSKFGDTVNDFEAYNFACHLYDGYHHNLKSSEPLEALTKALNTVLCDCHILQGYITDVDGEALSEALTYTRKFQESYRKPIKRRVRKIHMVYYKGIKAPDMANNANVEKYSEMGMILSLTQSN